MRTLTLAAAVAAAFVATHAIAQQDVRSQQPANPRVVSAVPRYTDTMKDLLDAAQRLRESVQVLAMQPASPERNDAMSQARRALMQAQRSMVDLPAGMRSTGDRILRQGDAGIQAGQPRRPRGTPMDELRDASDRLLDAVSSMSKQPAGERRDEAIADAHDAWGDAHAAMLTLSNARSTKAASLGANQAFAVMLVPMTIVADEGLNDGCWARVYENPDFGGSSLTLVGPVDVPRLDRTVAGDWNGADSLVAGSKASVTVYDEEGFRERSALVRPAEHVANLKSLTGGVLEKAGSLKVTCTA
jgi:hypothetical protein